MGLTALITRTIDHFYIGAIRKIVPQQVFRYLACGALNALLDAVWYFVIYNFIVAKRTIDLGFATISPHILSLAIVFPITFLTGFWLNRNVAFRTPHIDSGRQLLRYALSVVGSIVLNYVCMKLLVESLGIWPTPSKLITTGICAVYSYLIGRFYTFVE
ncbi:MAG: GtrA family protein [Alistipes sp.]|nr:GtrA family protein [Alistipes sp.]